MTTDNRTTEQIVADSLNSCFRGWSESSYGVKAVVKDLRAAGRLAGAARVTPTREQLSKLLYFQRVSDNAAENAPEISKLCDEAADAVLALITELAEGQHDE